MALCISPAPDALPRSHHYSTCTSSLFQHCTDLHQLKQIHARIIRRNLHGNQLLLTKLLRLYCSHGKLDYATRVFDKMPKPQTFAWNLIIRAHTTHNRSRRAIVLYNLMISNGVSPDKFTFPFTIKACTATRVLDKGKEVHGLAVKSGFSKDIYFRNTLIDFYLKCGELDHGRKVFDKMSVRNVVTWTTMLSGLVDAGDLDSALKLFDEMPVRNVVTWTAIVDGYVRKGKLYESFELFWQMQSEGIRPNEHTLVCLLRACSELRSHRLGALIHDYAIKNELKLGVYLGTALIDMYSKCGSLDEAKKVFDLMDYKSTATWNSMISSFGVHGFGEEAITLFEQMVKEKEVHPDAISFVGVLCACVQTNDVERGLSYFKYMIESYGIIPILDHYVCMFQLWGQSKKVYHESR